MNLPCRHYELLSCEPGITHCVTGRDPRRRAEFSLALHTGEPRAEILANRRSLRTHFGPGASFVSVRQVHGDQVLVVDRKEERGWESLDASPRADALVTNIPEVVLCILTADCVPILLYDPARRAIAAVHAGWRGSRLRIASKTVATMRARYGSDPGEIRALIGPAIGGCCYEVGAEVSEHFSGVENALVAGTGGRFKLDLKEVNRRQLLESGLDPSRIETAAECTACDRNDFFSYRALGGCSGRFLSAIMLKA